MKQTNRTIGELIDNDSIHILDKGIITKAQISKTTNIGGYIYLEIDIGTIKINKYYGNQSAHFVELEKKASTTYIYIGTTLNALYKYMLDWRDKYNREVGTIEKYMILEDGKHLDKLEAETYNEKHV